MGEANKWASGQWQVMEGRADDFVERWKIWLGWTSESIPGFRSARLLRSQDDSQRFTSVSDWDDDAALAAWTSNPGFQEKFDAVRELCDDFRGGNFDLAASVPGPSAV
jgi:heme-degrading monooxygenase HmoA